MYDKTKRIFTIDNQSNLTLNIDNNYLDQSNKSVLMNYIGLDIVIIPSKQREKYITPNTHILHHKNKRFIYVPNQTVFNTYGDLIQLGNYELKEINKDFNKRITCLSKTFRERLNIIGNLMDLNLTKTQIHKKAKTNFAYRNWELSERVIYEDIQKTVLTKELFIKWQKYACMYNNSPIYFKAEALKLLDVRKSAQKAINKKRPAMALLNNKMIYTQVIQHVNGPGI